VDSPGGSEMMSIRRPHVLGRIRRQLLGADRPFAGQQRNAQECPTAVIAASRAWAAVTTEMRPRHSLGMPRTS